MRTTDEVIDSPFDPYLSRFLMWGATQVHGFSHASSVRAMADDAGWQPAFGEAIFTSAQVRGLIGPHYGTRARGRVLWQVTRRGNAWLEADRVKRSNESESTSATATDLTGPA
jgi:hypothetical protein